VGLLNLVLKIGLLGIGVNVTDLNECGTEINKPEETTDCSVQCIPNWECNAWGTCTNNIQTRTCVDSNDCGIVSGKPITTQSCGDVVCPADVKQCSDGSYLLLLVNLHLVQNKKVFYIRFSLI